MWHKQTCVSLSVFLSEGKSVSVSKRPCCHWERWARDWHVCSNPAWSIYRINLLRYISRNRFNPSRRMRRKLSAPWCDPTDWLIDWVNDRLIRQGALRCCPTWWSPETSRIQTRSSSRVPVLWIRTLCLGEGVWGGRDGRKRGEDLPRGDCGWIFLSLAGRWLSRLARWLAQSL